MNEERLLTVVVIVAYGAAGALGAALFGRGVGTMWLIVAVVWLVWDRDRLHGNRENDRADTDEVRETAGEARAHASEARDLADAAAAKAALALLRTEQIARHLTDTEPPASGRHAHPDELVTEALPQLHPNSFVGGGPVGEGPTVAHQTEGER